MVSAVIEILFYGIKKITSATTLLIYKTVPPKFNTWILHKEGELYTYFTVSATIYTYTLFYGVIIPVQHYKSI